MMREIKLGDKVKCKITGFIGTAVARTEYINGCTQYNVVGKVAKDGKYPEEMSIDIESLEVLLVKKKAIKKSDTGGATTRGIKQRGY